MSERCFPTFRTVIELWSTREACASETGATPAQVSKWWQRNRIPDEWGATVLSTATAKEAGLTAADLVRLAARPARNVLSFSEARA